MKKFLTVLSLVAIAGTSANAVPFSPYEDYSPVAMVGVSYNFKGDFGLTVKVLSSDEENKPAFSVGATYYPTTGKFGINGGAGYVSKNSAATISYDFLNQEPELSLGYAKTQSIDINYFN